MRVGFRCNHDLSGFDDDREVVRVRVPDSSPIRRGPSPALASASRARLKFRTSAPANVQRRVSGVRRLEGMTFDAAPVSTCREAVPHLHLIDFSGIAFLCEPHGAGLEKEYG